MNYKYIECILINLHIIINSLKKRYVALLFSGDYPPSTVAMTITVDFTDTVCELLFESKSDHSIVIEGDVLINLCRKQTRSSTETLFETFLEHVFQCVESASRTINHYFFVDSIDDDNVDDDNVENVEKLVDVYNEIYDDIYSQKDTYQRTPDYSSITPIVSMSASSIDDGLQFSPISAIISSQDSRLCVDVVVE
jgi:hypothetical protein